MAIQCNLTPPTCAAVRRAPSDYAHSGKVARWQGQGSFLPAASRGAFPSHVGWHGVTPEDVTFVKSNLKIASRECWEFARLRRKACVSHGEGNEGDTRTELTSQVVAHGSLVRLSLFSRNQLFDNLK